MTLMAKDEQGKNLTANVMVYMSAHEPTSFTFQEMPA